MRTHTQTWQRYFPAVEHARAAIEAGEIGEVVTVQSDFPDKCYALTPAPLAYGAAVLPHIAAAGHKPAGRHGAAVLMYPKGGATVNTLLHRPIPTLMCAQSLAITSIVIHARDLRQHVPSG
jgi:hypothetical protein